MQINKFEFFSKRCKITHVNKFTKNAIYQKKKDTIKNLFEVKSETFFSSIEHLVSSFESLCWIACFAVGPRLRV